MPGSTGSSPLTRGKLLQPCYSLVTGGLIPAHAGKTPAGRGGGAGARAHPRSRGENSSYPRGGRTSWGSSPLTRGKLARGDHDGRIKGLIPAHAGKTTGSQTPAPRAGAHPRSRGENGRAPRISAPHTGSSPLTRGKQRVDLGGCVEVRLIPAHAGKTVSGLGARQRGGAHPRSRGENGLLILIALVVLGSSPLTRGKPCRGSRPRAAPGLIPAHAGKT